VFLTSLQYFSFFFYRSPSTTEIYTLSLHHALPIWRRLKGTLQQLPASGHLARFARFTLTSSANRDLILGTWIWRALMKWAVEVRSEEHTSELQSRFDLVCRLLLEKKKKNYINYIISPTFYNLIWLKLVFFLLLPFIGQLVLLLVTQIFSKRKCRRGPPHLIAGLLH